MISLPAVAARTFLAVWIWPGMGRSSWMRSWNGPTEARNPSMLMAPIKSAESRSASPSTTAKQPMAAMNCVPLSRERPSLASRVTGASPAARRAGPAGSRPPSTPSNSPSPIMASTRCAEGARSPEAPSEPREGTQGTRSALSMATSSSATSTRTPECPRAMVLSRTVMAARTTSRESGAPTPAAWLRTRFSCSSRTLSRGMCVVASWPKPVVTPYTTSPRATTSTIT